MRRLYTSRENLILLVTVIVLTIVGIIFIYDFTRADNIFFEKTYYLERQSVYAVCGLLCALVFSRVDYHKLYAVYCWMFFVIVAMIFLNLFMNWGWIYRGCFYIGNIVFDGAQIILTLSLLIFTDMIQHKNICSVKVISYCIAVACLLFSMRDFQGIVLFVLVIIPIAFIKDWKAALVFSVPAVIGVVSILQDVYYVPRWISVWLDPFSDRYNWGYEIVNSMYSIASGGMFGVGVGEGKAAYCLPDALSTYMMAGITREIGWFGAFGILAVYCVFLATAFKIACRAIDKYGFYISAVITVRYAVMLVLHLFTVANMIPPVGIFLPFISYSGTRLLTDFILLGILFNIASQRAEYDRRMGI